VSFSATRLGAADWLIGTGAAALLIDLFAVPWFAYRPQYQGIAIVLARRVSLNGWQAFTLVGPLTLLVSVTGAAVFWLQGARRSPALPVAVTTLLAPVALVLLVTLGVRVLFDQPNVALSGGGNALEARPGAYLALGLSLVICVGLYLSLRREGIATEDAPSAIETLDIPPSSPAAPRE
jgi:hypothetical protein